MENKKQDTTHSKSINCISANKNTDLIRISQFSVTINKSVTIDALSDNIMDHV